MSVRKKKNDEGGGRESPRVQMEGGGVEMFLLNKEGGCVWLREIR